jgi:hypothetical protein
MVMATPPPSMAAMTKETTPTVPRRSELSCVMVFLNREALFFQKVGNNMRGTARVKQSTPTDAAVHLRTGALRGRLLLLRARCMAAMAGGDTVGDVDVDVDSCGDHSNAPPRYRPLTRPRDGSAVATVSDDGEPPRHSDGDTRAKAVDDSRRTSDAARATPPPPSTSPSPSRRRDASADAVADTHAGSDARRREPLSPVAPSCAPDADRNSTTLRRRALPTSVRDC